ncbi:MAG: hypothetical protein K2I79_00805 [Clostridia bacterium]|nr:hypothetical protein [Clostridia bacterium]
MKKSSKLILLILTVVICVSLIALTACNDKTSINSKMSKSELKEALNDVSNYTVETLVKFKAIDRDDEEITVEHSAIVELDLSSKIAHVVGYEAWSIQEDERVSYEQYITKDANYVKCIYNEDGIEVYPWSKMFSKNIDNLMNLDDNGEILLGEPNLLLARTMSYVKMALADPSVKVDGNGWYSYKGTLNYAVFSLDDTYDKDNFELKFKVNDKGEIEFSYDVESANKALEKGIEFTEISLTGKITWINKTGSVKKAYDKAKPQIDKDIADGDY